MYVSKHTHTHNRAQRPQHMTFFCENIPYPLCASFRRELYVNLLEHVHAWHSGRERALASAFRADPERERGFAQGFRNPSLSVHAERDARLLVHGATSLNRVIRCDPESGRAELEADTRHISMVLRDMGRPRVLTTPRMRIWCSGEPQQLVC